MIYFECKQFYRYCEEKEKPIEKQVYSEEEEQKIIGLLHLEYERKPQYIPNYVVELAYLTGMRVSGFKMGRFSFRRERAIFCYK